VHFKENGKTYPFSVVYDKIVFLICITVVSVPREYNFHRHYEISHIYKLCVLEVELRENKLQNLKSDLQRQRNIRTVAAKSNEAAFHASIAISQTTARK
jgi:hypothetical protein